MSNKVCVEYSDGEPKGVLKVRQVYTRFGYKATKMAVGAFKEPPAGLELTPLSMVNYLKLFEIAFDPILSKIKFDNHKDAFDFVYRLIPKRYMFSDGQPRNLTVPNSSIHVNWLDDKNIMVHLTDNETGKVYRKYHVTYIGNQY